MGKVSKINWRTGGKGFEAIQSLHLAVKADELRQYEDIFPLI